MTHRPAAPVRVLAAAVAVLTALSLVITTAVESPDRAQAYTTKIYRGAHGSPYIGAIGDSTLAAVRWYNSYGDFYEYNFVFDAESCRRTIDTSCRGREGYAPENVVTVMRRLDGKFGRVLVLMTGYDDPGYRFDDGVDAVVAEARRQGIDKVMWLTLRTADVAYVAPEYHSDSYTFRDNNRILLQKAVQYRGYVQVSDWATHSANNSSWVESDGVHLTYSGTQALTRFIINQVDRVAAGKTVTPAPGAGSNTTWTPVRRGDYGSRVVTVQRALINKGFEVVGGADGDFGAYTEDAVKRFQRSRGLDDSGIVGPITAERLGIYTPPPPEVANPSCKISRTLHPGERLSQVRCLKLHLASRGFPIGRYDGRFGNAAVEAVKYFKAVRGGSYTGTAGTEAVRWLGAYAAPPDRPDCEFSRILRKGERLKEVRCLTRTLAAFGFRNKASYSYNGGAAEAVGFLKDKRGMPRTSATAVQFLRSVGLWKSRPDRPDCRISHPMVEGDRDGAFCLKKHLRANGYQTRAGQRYDRFVTMAIKHVEAENGLRVDGTAGESVLRILRAWRDPGTATSAPPDESEETTGTTEAPTTTLAPTTTIPPTTTTPPTTIVAPATTVATTPATAAATTETTAVPSSPAPGG